jgi:arginase family enzyme
MSKRTQAIVFPFGLFGSPGAEAGAKLLADELREILADNRRETARTRAAAYSTRVRITEAAFSTIEELAAWRDTGRKMARAALKQGDHLLWIAGNHLGVLPVYDVLSPRKDTLVLQLDAHLDIHAFRDTAKTLTHGNFLLHVDGGVPPIINVGHRDLLLTKDAVARYFREAIPAAALHADAPSVLKRVGEACRAAKHVFLDIDCDVFDPAFFPAVAEPVPFGLSPGQVLAVIEAAGRIDGMLLSEFDPARDVADRSLAALAWLVEHLLLMRHE